MLRIADPGPVTVRFPFLVLLFLAVPYFINLDKSALWDGNETFYAETPREMLETGNYLAPMFNYEPRPQKPPLTYWFVLLAYRVLGVGELAVRLPGALAVAGTILLVFATGRMLFHDRAALLAAAMYATSLRVFVLARKLPIDVLLVFWTAATAYFLLRALSRDSTRAWLSAWLCAALGFLTKGPVAVVIPGLGFAAWSLWSRRASLRQAHPLAGLAILAAVVAPWYLLTYRNYGWTYITDFFLQDNFARFASEIKGPVRGPLYYLPVFLIDFFPWSILSVAGVAYVWIERRQLRSRDALTSGFALSWSAATVLFFSLSKNKQEYYIAPIYPILAVWLAGVFAGTAARASELGARMRPYWTAGLVAIAVVFVAGACFSPLLLSALVPDRAAVLHYAPAVLLLLAVGALGGLLARKRLVGGVAVAAAAVWLLFVVSGVSYLPALEPLRPVKEICRVVRREARPQDEIGYYRAAVPSMLFYLRRPIFSVSDPDTMVRRFQSGTKVFCVVSPNDYEYFTQERKVALSVLGRYPQLPTRLRTVLAGRPTPGDDLLLVCNRPADSASAGERQKNP